MSNRNRRKAKKSDDKMKTSELINLITAIINLIGVVANIILMLHNS